MKISAIILVFLYASVEGKNKTTIFNELLTWQNNYYKNLDLQSLSASCNISIIGIMGALDLGSTEQMLEALKFLDSSSKIPNGILNANLYDFGSYDECMGIRLQLEYEEVWGKYCLGASTIGIPNTHVDVRLQMAYCVPHTCTDEDLTALVPIGDFQPAYCYTKHDKHELDKSDTAAIVFFSYFLFMVILSTGVDIIYRYYKFEQKSQVVLAFSLWTNGKKLFQTSSNSEQLSCINGIKAISMMWVILGHSGSATLVDNGIDRADAMKKFQNMYLIGAHVSVDTFFLIGGLLVMYVFLKSRDKGVKTNWPLYYLHRYIRLTPALVALVVFNATLLRYFGDGPLWGANEENYENCRKYWWSTLLYIQNYINLENTCSGQTWYLSVDMQLFVLTPLVLIPLQKWPKYTIYIFFVLISAGILVPTLITYEKDLPSSMALTPTDQLMPYLKYYYAQTYARFGPYVIGMAAGYLIFDAQKNPVNPLNLIKRSKMAITILWLFAISGLFSCTYGGYDVLTLNITDILSRSLYNGINRNAWAVSVSMVIILCSLNCGGPINDFLSAPIFQFFSKLSYSMYLVHVTWLAYIRMYSSRVVTHFSDMDLWFTFWGNFVITIFASFVMCIVFESPMIIIEKAMFGNRGKKQTTKSSPNPA